MFHSQISSLSKDGPARQFDVEIASAQIQIMVRDEINDLYGRQKRDLWAITEHVDSLSRFAIKSFRVMMGLLAFQFLLIFGIFGMIIQGAL